MPAAFLSYVHSDDQHGRISEFRERLSDEVRIQTGEEFSIFQDRNDILWGQNWQERIEETLDGVTFLIPVVTPSFFKSPYCRKELERFLEREKKLRRTDLILSVYYVGTPQLDDEKRRAADSLAAEIAKHQYADWRDLRIEPFTSPQVAKTLAQLATQIRDAVERGAAPAKPRRTRGKAQVQGGGTGGEAEATQASTGEEGTTKKVRIPPKTEPPTHVVDPLHRGDFPTVSDAIVAAKPGDRIIVRPGLYEEGLIVDKPLEIIGDGELGEVVVQATGKNALLFRTTMGRVSNLALRQMGGGNWFGVDITQGRLELEGCDISSQSLACVAIHSGADPRLRRNRIHDGKQSGVLVHKNGQGTLEDNDIFGNAYSGVAIATGGNPVVRRNRIHDSKEGGVYVYENGQGTLEDNDIFGNAKSGVAIATGGNPVVRRNRIHDSEEGGVYVYKNGQGTLEDNDIFGNAKSGVAIATGGNPVVRRNRIHDGKQSGVYVYENGQGTLEDNDIFGNAYSGVAIKTGGNPVVRHSRINKNGYGATKVYDGGRGTFLDNDLRDNTGGSWNIAADCEPNVTRRGNQQ